MSTIAIDDPIAVAAIRAIQDGHVEALRRLLQQHRGLAAARLGTGGEGGTSRTLLHVATDWPGHLPHGPATVKALIEAGADVDARFAGPHNETPLHWAASSDDVEVLDVLLDAGADIEASGSVIAGGTPLADAVAFGQWRAAQRLVERGARATLWQAAALGMMARVEEELGATPAPPEEITSAFWCACHGGQRETAEYLLDRGADRDWVGYDELTPLDAARRSGASELVEWLCGRGARSAEETAP
jgi:ankyrin repeat protein